MKNLYDNKKNGSISSEMSNISKKNDVKLAKNSSLYFQIGLILSLMATYFLFEMNFKRTNIFIPNEPTVYTKDFYLPNIQIEPKAVETKQPEKQMAVLITKAPVIKPDTFVIKEPTDMVTPDSAPAVVTPTTNAVQAPAPIVPVVPINNPFNMKDVERVPIFPGCESATTNLERMACMSEKLTKLVQNKFNTDLASKLGLSGIQKIHVQFKIDDQGRVTDIKSRATNSQLEKEAERVVGKIPLMTPGMQRNTPVAVIYNLPIVFQVQ